MPQKTPKQNKKEENQSLDSIDLTDLSEASETDLDTKAALTDTPAKNPLTRKHSAKKPIVITVILVLLVCAVLLAVPQTRYPILGTVIKKPVTITLTDSKTHRPITGAELTLAGKIAKTDTKGQARFKDISVGPKTISAKKKYYKNAAIDVTVPLRSPKQPFMLDMQATGRQVAITVVNKISGQPLARVTIAALDTSASTDADGQATLVLPADKTAVEATISATNYHKQTVTVQVTEQTDPKNSFSLTPAGTVYFLSKRTGNIDVMQSDLDGGNAKVVLAGTGQEEESGTVLLASRDWKYLLLKARRDSEKPKLYLIDTANNNDLSVVDEGDVEFTLNGWHKDQFVYTITRSNLDAWQPKHQALKVFDAPGKKLSIADESDAKGDTYSNYAQEQIGSVYILDEQVVYAKSWIHSYGWSDPDTRTRIMAIKPDGTQKKSVADFGIGDWDTVSARLYKPQEVYFRIQEGQTFNYYEYEEGNVKKLDTKTAEVNFEKQYPTFIISPNGQQAFWSESRDGKKVLFLGNKEGNDSKQIVTSDLTPYGWYGDDYLLASKNDSELYIMLRADAAKTVKVTDYHKPNVNFSGYGYGYGGF